MSTATANPPTVPAGTWKADAKHSSAAFEIEHAGVSTFRGAFKQIDATLESGPGGLELRGSVPVDSISIDDESIRPHILSPEFFDADRHPTLDFRSTELTGSADGLALAGELTMAGVSVPVTATGRLRGPVSGPGGQLLALELEAEVDRTAFGMSWQMDLPGGGTALGNEVRLVVTLELGLQG